MNLFVAGLPYDLDDAELMEFFEKFGTVNSAKVAIDKETGKSRGFAFVEMANDDEGLEAIDGLNELYLGKKQLIVKQAEQRSGGSGGGGSRPRQGGGGFNNNNRGGGGFNRGGNSGGYNNRNNDNNRNRY